MFQRIFAFLIFLAILIPVNSALAVFKESEGSIFIGKDEVIDDNLMVVADLFDLEGTVNGDVIVAANRAQIKGTVKGDVIVLAHNLILEGEVEGDIRLLGRTVDVSSAVSGNATILASDFKLLEKGEIGHSVTAFGNSIMLSGSIAKNVTAFAHNAFINSPVGGSILINLNNGGRIVVGEKGRIGGDINYVSKNELERNAGSEVAGIVRRIEPSVRGDVDFAAFFFFIGIIGALSIFVIGLFAINLFIKELSDMSKSLIEKPWENLARGIICFFFVPIALLFIALTIIGIPLAFILGSLFMASLMISRVIAAFTIGSFIVSRMGKGRESHPVTLLIFGVLLLWIIGSIPLIGIIFGLFTLWWALGALTSRVLSAIRQPAEQ